jgi:uncharacterized membrane protein
MKSSKQRNILSFVLLLLLLLLLLHNIPCYTFNVHTIKNIRLTSQRFYKQIAFSDTPKCWQHLCKLRVFFFSELKDNRQGFIPEKLLGPKGTVLYL